MARSGADAGICPNQVNCFPACVFTQPIRLRYQWMCGAGCKEGARWRGASWKAAAGEGGLCTWGAMTTALEVALALCIWAAINAEAAPQSGTSQELPIKIVHLQKPDVDDAARFILSKGAGPPPEAATALGGEVRIVHGRLAANVSHFPHQAAMTVSDDAFCGGSLISPRWVLTAAHCISARATWVKVHLGALCWASAPLRLYATRAVLHGAFDGFWLFNDIALLDLGGDVDLAQLAGLVQTVELETEGCRGTLLDDEQGVVSGWGLTSQHSTVPNEECLRYVDTQTINNYDCCLYYGYSDDGMICSVNSRGLNGTFCPGDSGGPLIWTKTGRQIGITSYYSQDCGCEANWPNGYTRVPCYIDWIAKARSV